MGEVHLDTSGYKPDELKVQVEGNTVRVEEARGEKSGRGGDGEQAVRQGVRPSRGEQAGGRGEQSQQGRSAGYHHAKAKEGHQHEQELECANRNQVTDLWLCNYLPSVSIFPKAFSALYILIPNKNVCKQQNTDKPLYTK